MTRESHGQEIELPGSVGPWHPVWAGKKLRYAYFIVGRYEDALHIVERQPIETYTNFDRIMRAVTNAALNRPEEAKIWVAQALEKDPKLTIQGFLSRPGWGDKERVRMLETMRQAGFPLCASAQDLAGIPKPLSLPECLTH